MSLKKQQIRAAIRETRRTLSARKQRSETILDRLRQCVEYSRAESVLCYLGHRSEVQTESLIAERLQNAQQTLLPWCKEDELRLFRLHSLDELEPGAFGIPEPGLELKNDPTRAADVQEVDLILIPGLAFDRNGGRLGQGKGFYDKLLSRARETTTLVGIGFDCQLVDHVPTEPHDVPLQIVITESETIRIE